MREPYFIGHANKPRCFKKKSVKWGFLYRSNKKVWMTGVLFREWLRSLDNDMENQRRKVLLMIHNTSSHCTTGMVHRSVKVLYLPPNTTSKLQPLDAGIIAALKMRYRHRQLQAALDKEEEGIQRDIYAVDQLTAMKWVKACRRDIHKKLVLNCFRHTGIVLGRTSSVHSKKETDAVVHGELSE
ncbi:LOW QUALITY PROTEIN: Hypothetical protein PHPALM_13429 [Phytophthora palmivora]|uniref:DDE-1 domain-containing protein n=1 Tax=Phytophthora palmivora TaxID=4796 RepID=A0A2P4XXB1_9STRA|nr:LOW QUALITY PROTEIN: Hypothetical protein PHPALM_13429 [Phytophthora palmivora]